MAGHGCHWPVTLPGLGSALCRSSKTRRPGALGPVPELDLRARLARATFTIRPGQPRFRGAPSRQTRTAAATPRLFRYDTSRFPASESADGRALAYHLHFVHSRRASPCLPHFASASLAARLFSALPLQRAYWHPCPTCDMYVLLLFLFFLSFPYTDQLAQRAPGRRSMSKQLELFMGARSLVGKSLVPV